jgi:hypothetical protein
VGVTLGTQNTLTMDSRDVYHSRDRRDVNHSRGAATVQYQMTAKQEGLSSIVFQATTAMPQYEQKLFEELRYEDYAAGNRGTQGQVPLYVEVVRGGLGRGTHRVEAGGLASDDSGGVTRFDINNGGEMARVEGRSGEGWTLVS